MRGQYLNECAKNSAERWAAKEGWRREARDEAATVVSARSGARLHPRKNNRVEERSGKRRGKWPKRLRSLQTTGESVSRTTARSGRVEMRREKSSPRKGAARPAEAIAPPREKARCVRVAWNLRESPARWRVQLGFIRLAEEVCIVSSAHRPDSGSQQKAKIIENSRHGLSVANLVPPDHLFDFAVRKSF